MPVDRDLGQAREAYGERDAAKSRMAHLAKRHADSEKAHNRASGGIVSSLVFGGLDGITTTFAVLVASAAAKTVISSLLIITFANLIGDAVGMAVGDWLGSIAEDDMNDKKIKEAKDKIEAFPERERLLMVKVYRDMGMPIQDAEEMVRLLLENPKGFLKAKCIYGDIGAVEEDDDDDSPSPLKSSLVTFSSFLILGGLPMLAYAFSFSYDEPASVNYIFWISIALFLICLFSLGAIKGLITNTPWWKSGLSTTAQGGVTTLAAYLIGFGFEKVGD